MIVVRYERIMVRKNNSSIMISGLRTNTILMKISERDILNTKVSIEKRERKLMKNTEREMLNTERIITERRKKV